MQDDVPCARSVSFGAINRSHVCDVSSCIIVALLMILYHELVFRVQFR